MPPLPRAPDAPSKRELSSPQSVASQTQDDITATQLAEAVRQVEQACLQKEVEAIDNACAKKDPCDEGPGSAIKSPPA